MKQESRTNINRVKKDISSPDSFTPPEELKRQLITTMQSIYDEEDIEAVERAYKVAYKAHEKQKRKSGEPYIIHPICVAIILAELELDKETIMAGLLHDVVEDTETTHEDIVRDFGEEVAQLVDGVTKLGQLSYSKDKIEVQAENLRKMFLAMAKDIRVILIKLADRLHNMRTLKYMRPEKQKEKARETMDIYAPIAHRLGISKIKVELDDLSMKYLMPEVYKDLTAQIDARMHEREAYIKRIVADVKKHIDNAHLDAEIDGRVKHLFSIYKKMKNQNKTLDQIYDIFAVRIKVETVRDCYSALGIIHEMYKPIPGRFKDYIAMPKSNMYQSLHTTLIGPEGQPFEIQIRTFEMHRTAEYGIAAHWKYKEGDTSDTKGKSFENKLVWLRDMLEWQKETSDAEEFMEGFKINLFTDEIFLFTPKGVVIDLPNGATPIDFAYRIHTDIGNKCIGAKVNGKIVPLDYKLKTGQIVEILTSNSSKGPNMDWLSIAKSNQAKSKIKAWFKKAKKEENINKGKEVFEKELKKQSVHYVDIAKGESYDKFIKRYNINCMDDLYALVGLGAIVASSFIAKLKEENLSKDEKDKNLNKAIEENISKNEKKKKYTSYGVTVKGENNLMVRFAKCCNPVPGDDILGYITKGRGVSIHRKDCGNLNNLIKEDPQKVVDVSWGTSNGVAYMAEIQVKTEDKSGILSDVMNILMDSKLPLNALNAKSAKGNLAYINIKIKIDTVEQLKELMKKIKRVPGVLDVYRMNN